MPVGPLSYAGWIVLPALASGLLLAVTNALSESVAAMPLLWVLPLSVYLITFVIAFSAGRLYARSVFLPLALVSLGLLWRMDISQPDQALWRESGMRLLALLALFALGTVCHGELMRCRPDVTHLTRYYLAISAGGALGGLFVGVIAPRVFASTVELRLLAMAIPIAAGVLFASGTGASEVRPHRFGTIRQAGVAFATAGAVLAFFATDRRLDPEALVAEGRNFFGVLRIEDTQESESDPIVRTLFDGRIVHGAERLDPKRPREPVSYYSRVSGLGMVRRRISFPNRRIGVVGLGAGAVAGYGRRGDVVRFYENNPLSERYARDYFTFLPKCPCTTEVVMGDARISMDREAARRYDVLAVHISNWYIDLAPVLRGAARTFNLRAVLISTEADDAQSTIRPTGC